MSIFTPNSTLITHIYTGPLDDAPEGDNLIFFPVHQTHDFREAVIDAQLYANEIGLAVSFDDLRYAVVASQPAWVEFTEEHEAYAVLAVDKSP